MVGKSAIIISLLLSVLTSQAIADNNDDEAVFIKFLKYTQATYADNVRSQMSRDEYYFTFAGTNMSARLLGYSLGNLLQYARRGSDNHKTWLMLETKVRESIYRKIEEEGGLRGWDSNFIENRKQKAWQQCMATQQGWFDELMAAMTSVRPENAPDFFATLNTTDERADSGETTGNEHDGDRGSAGENTQNSQDVDVNPGTVGDEILGRWTYTHEYTYMGETVKQKFVVVIQRAGTVERESYGGTLLVHLYEGFIFEAVGFENQGYHSGQRCWEIKYYEGHQPPSDKYLGYTMNSLLDQYGNFEIRLNRREGILEINRIKYYR